MAFRVVWTQTALSDLQTLVRYVASANPEAARRLAERILDQIQSASAVPFAGRVVPEMGDDNMRERFLRPYRVVYMVNESEGAIHGVRIWHAA